MVCRREVIVATSPNVEGDATALQCRQRHRRTGGAHPGTATPLHLTAVRVGAEQCNSRAGGQRQQIAVVLQQHRAGDRCALDDVARGIAVVGELVGRHLAHARPVEEVQQPANRFVDAGFGGLACEHCGQQLLAALARWPRHLQVEARFQGAGRGVSAEPVADDHTVEAPLVAQQVAQQLAMLARVDAVDAVVRAHQRTHIGTALGDRPDRSFEGHQVRLAQGDLVDLTGDGVTLELGVVADEVLDAARDAVLLHAGDVADGDPFERASRPSASPTSCTNDGSKVAPSAVPHGNEADAGPVHDVPRTPAGPSLVRIGGMPGNATVCQLSCPASRLTFCSSVSEASAASMSIVMPPRLPDRQEWTDAERGLDK